MNWLLFVTVTLMGIYNYFRCKRVFLHPSVIACAMFSVSTLLMAMNEDKWKWEVSFNTFAYLTVALMMFSIAVGIGEHTYLSKHRVKRTSYWLYRDVSFSQLTTIILSIICLAVSFLYFRHQYTASVALGNSFGVPGMISVLRQALVVEPDAEVLQIGTVLNLGISFVKAVGLVCLYLIVYKLFNKEKGWHWYIIPVLCLIINIILATGRGGFISIVAAIVFDIYIVGKQNQDKKINKEIIRYSAILVAVFIPVFFILGSLTGKNEALNFNDTISIYLGSSILCFDYFLNHGWRTPSFFGFNTFRGLYGMIGRFIGGLPAQSNHSDMVRWQEYSSNVYTTFAPYVMDFGIIGSFIIIIFVGVFFGYMWRLFLKQKTITFYSVVYGGLLGYALSMFPIAERLLSNYIALNVIAQLLFIYILLKYFVKKEKVKLQ